MDAPPLVPLLVRATLALLADWLSPPRCAACREWVPARTIFCSGCASSVVEAPNQGRFRVAPFMYGGAIAAAIVAFKYERRPHLARPLGDLLCRGAARFASYSPHVIVPVPLHPARLAERGFNQAALLARTLVAPMAARFAPLALARDRDTPQQATLDRAARLRNLRDAFSARDPRAVDGRRVLLVDDVCTTGATLDACERTLRAAGAADVRALVIARS
jgi:ComF family protein